MVPSQRHVLALNDSQEILFVLRALLEEEGYRVTSRSRLVKELDEIREIAPDLIILDYMWPQEDAGWSTLQLLRMDREIGAIPIILCTGATREVEGISAQLSKMRVRVVIKPFDIDTLLGEVADALDPSTE